MFMIRAAAVAVVPLCLACLVGSAAARTRNVDTFPVLGLARETSPDRPFLVQAWHLSIDTLKRSREQIAATRLANVQAEAVRAYNSAAEAYNGLVDLALERGMRFPERTDLFSQDVTPTPLDGTPVLPQDIAYFTDREAEVRRTIALYRREAEHGKDRRVAIFASIFAAHLERDLMLTTTSLADLSASARYGDRAPEGAAPDAFVTSSPASR